MGIIKELLKIGRRDDICPDMSDGGDSCSVLGLLAGLWGGHDARDRQAMIRRSQRRMTRRLINGGIVDRL